MLLDSGLKLKLVINCHAAYLVSRERVALTTLLRALLLVLMSELVCTPIQFKVLCSNSKYLSIHATRRRTEFTILPSIRSKQNAKQRTVSTFTKCNIIRATDRSHVIPSRWMRQPHSCIHDYIVVFLPKADGGEVIIAVAMSFASAEFLKLHVPPGWC